ncbi:MAG: hypothetical protein DRI46_14160, partial [Chloroflexi bacterium]
MLASSKQRRRIGFANSPRWPSSKNASPCAGLFYCLVTLTLPSAALLRWVQITRSSRRSSLRESDEGSSEALVPDGPPIPLILKQRLKSSVFVIIDNEMTKKLSANTYTKLNDGRLMPSIGLGVSGLDNDTQTEDAVSWALDANYRHIDTAKLYGNEASVGRAIRDYKIERDEVWVTTKLWPTDFANPKKAIKRSLEQLNIDFIDLYLVHWPTPVEIPGFDKKLWRTMEHFKKEGLCKSIGVSNFQAKRLTKLLDFTQTPPAVNQVRCSPFHYPKELYDFCTTNDVQIVGYNPLNQGEKLDNTILLKTAKLHRKTAAQVMLRW